MQNTRYEVSSQEFISFASESYKKIDMLHNIVAGISTEIGKAFFQSLVTFLAKSLETDYAFVGELSETQPGTVKTIALYSSGEIIDNFEYRLKDTPCEQVIGGKLCFYPRDVQRQFPKDTLLKDMNIISYMGTPLFDSKKHPIGLIVVMDSKPMKNEKQKKYLFQIFAVRAASEIERRRYEKSLKKERDKVQNYLDNAGSILQERTNELVKANEYLQQEIQTRKKAEKKLLDYQKQLQSLTSQMSLIEEHEKRRIATELHDCLGQTLALAKIKLGLLNKLVSAELKGNVKEILQLIEQTIKEARTLTFELSPPILYELGFDQAIKWLIDQFHDKYGTKFMLVDDGSDKPFDSNIRFFLFQAVRELMINIVKHARSDRAKIVISRRNNRLQISVKDKGIGFSSESVKESGYGLFNIRERMNHIGGKFEIKSTPGQGTSVTLVAPFNHNRTFHKYKGANVK